MDAKTPPPIPLQFLEKKERAKKQEYRADVSLPPLTSHTNTNNHRREKKPVVADSWPRHSTYPTCYQNCYKKRPYRVLRIGATPLMHACQQADRSRVLRLLTEQEESIGYRDRTLRSALHYCMDAGTGGAVASAAPELVNAPDAEGHSPLHLAVIAGDTQLVAVLLANGADVDAKDLEGHSVLHWATVCGEAVCVRLILAAGARASIADLRGGSPLHYAAQCCGAAATVELAVPKKLGLKVLQTLLEFGADVNAKDEDGRQPILWAASAGSAEAVLALARAGGAAAAGASDKDGLTALHCAASRGHVACIEALVNLCGSQPDHVDDNGCSALHYAATLGHADATALILRLGADPNRQDRKGRTPTLCAAAKGQLETLKILAQHGGSLQARTVRGTGVAHEAVASGRIELLEWLAKKRPSTLDISTQDGKTPLHVAALHGHLDACKMLLDHGARINAILRTGKGNAMTALDAALYRGHRDCAKLIQIHGGTTAQRLRIQKVTPNKVFSAKLRIKRIVESSTDTESSSRPRRCDRKFGYRGHPRVYYQEEEKRWIEKRTHRGGNSEKKLSRRDSRSFSEEEARSSRKASLRKERQRRTRSVSARYAGISKQTTVHRYDKSDDDSKEDDIDYRIREKRKGRKKRTSKGDYNEPSVECSHESSQEDIPWKKEEEQEENGTIETTYLRQKLQRKRRRSKHRGRQGHRPPEIEPTDRNRAVCSRSETRYVVKDEEHGMVSDDSLELTLVMKRTVEKTREKVVSDGGKLKTTNELNDLIVNTSRERTSKREKSKSPGSIMNSVNKEKNVVTPRRKTTMKASKNDARSMAKETEKGKNIVAEEEGASFVEGESYQRDVTDSTSHETVERVLVTAMVHKDPDTPKSMTGEVSKEIVVLNDASEKDYGWEPSDPVCKIDDDDDGDDVDEKSNKESSSVNSLLSKTAVKDSKIKGKKDAESMRQEAEEVVAKEGRLRALRISESERISLDYSQERHRRLTKEGQDPAETAMDEGAEFLKDSSFCSNNTEGGDRKRNNTSLIALAQKDATTVPNDSGDPISNTNFQIDEFVRSFECRAAPISLLRESAVPKVENDEGCKPSVEGLIAKTAKQNIDAKRKANETSVEKGTILEEPLAETDLIRAEESAEDREIVVIHDYESTKKKTGFEASKITTEKSSPPLPIALVGNDFFEEEDKERVDFANVKSVDFRSSDFRDFASTTREGGYGLQRIVTPGFTKGETPEIKSTEHKLSMIRRSKSVEIVQTDATTESFITNDEKAIISSKDESTPNVSPTRRSRRSRCRYSNQGASVIMTDTAAEKIHKVKKLSNKNKRLIKQSGERLPDRNAIVAVIESPGWGDEGEDEELDKEIRKVIEDDVEPEYTETEESNEANVVRVILPQVRDGTCMHSRMIHSPLEDQRPQPRTTKHRRDSGGRDSGIEPSPRVSRIPKRRNIINSLNTEKHETAFDIQDTITRDVQISLRRYHLERKIFFQLMELKRLQIRHGKANEQVLIKRQVESFHKAGMSGPTLGVARYDQPLTFRHFEAFLYDQLRKLQRRPATPNFCTDAKYCTQRTHRCHHATTAYTSIPVYTYLGGDVQERAADIFPKIETRGRGQMTVEVSNGDEKRVIALPAEKLDCTKRYFVTFTVTGGGRENQGAIKPKSSHSTETSAKSV